MLSELQDNVKTGDTMKATLVTDHLHAVDSVTQGKLLYILSRADVDFQVPILLRILERQADKGIKVELIHSSILSCLIAFPEKLPPLLVSDKIQNKSILVKLAGELRSKESLNAIMALLADTVIESDIFSLIECLGLIGDSKAVPVLKDYLYSASRELIMAAVNSLGRIGTSEAMEALSLRMDTDNDIDLAILAIFADVQDDVSIKKLSQTLASSHAHLRTFAKQQLVLMGNKAVAALLSGLESSDSDFVIHSLNVLGDIGDDSAVQGIRHLLAAVPANANVRFAAYEALALLPVKKGGYTLTAGLVDSEEHVCLAAARAIEKNYNDMFAGGIKNLLRGPEAEAQRIVTTIVKSEVDRLFISLITDDVFQRIAMQHLPSAHEDIRQRYSKLLVRAGKSDLARQVMGTQDTQVRQKVVAVDDSRMILNIYKSTLHELGFEPVLFEFPASALEWLATEKPLMVLTDLNMPDITGVQLTRKIREKYPKSLLPILMVTTQNEKNDNSDAAKAGIDGILQKPFTASSLGAAINKVLGV